MKKKILPLTLAAIMSFSGAAPVFAADGSWITGWTGKEGGKDYTVSETADGFVLSNDKVNNGKFTDGEDSIIYAAQKIAGDEDFTFSAEVSIDEYSVMEESSNPHQGSVGIAILDDTFSKTDTVTYTDSVFLGAWAADKKSDPAIYPIIRDNSDKKTVGDALSDSFKSEGKDLGTFKLSITKSGNQYTFDCDGKTYTAEVYNFEGDIYPCVYIARNVKATFKNAKLTVAAKKPVSIEIKEAQTEYTYGESFKGVTAVVAYSDGTSVETKDVSVKGYKPEHIGSQKLTVSAGGAKTTLNVTVRPHITKDIEVTYTPIKTSYAKNSVFSTQGMEVTAYYADGSKEVLSDDDYTVKLGGSTVKDGDILPQAGTLTAVVTRKNEKGYDSGTASARFKVEVSDKTITELELTPPVKTDYYIGDELDLSGMKVIAHYSDNTSELLEKRDFKVTGFDSDFKENGLKVAVEPISGGAKAEFKVNVKERTAEKLVVTKYPRTVYSIGDTPETELKAAILYDNGDMEETSAYTVDTSALDTDTVGEYTIYVRPADTSLDAVAIKASVEEETPHYWRKATFGQSSGYNDTEKTSISADDYGTVNGKINLRSWNGAGKITNDHDGMNFYYTQINAGEDFTLTADITVNKYLEHDNDDKKRNGQEAFGIMVKDVIPLEAEDGSQTVDPEKAKKDEVGAAVALDGDKVFASNMAILGGYSGTGWPSDTTDAQYEKKTQLNRINLLVREGVSAPDGGGTRIGPTALSDTFPKEGNKYTLTMQRVNGGLYVKCYDHQNDVTKDTFHYDESFLTAQSKEAYVGFFTARWADIDVENVNFYTGAKQYSQTVSAVKDDRKTADISVKSPAYSTDENYTLELSPSNSKGRVTVRLNEHIIAKDLEIEKAAEIKAKLRKNAENHFTVVYTPDDTQKLTSYEPVIVRHTVYQKDMSKTGAEVYVSPNGSFKGDGTKEKPFDLDSAAGLINPGQTIIMTEGTYYRNAPFETSKGNDGTASAYKTVKAEGKVVLDYQGEYAGAVLSGNYWHIEGIDFTNCGPNLKCVHLGGSHCIIENCKFYNNQDMGLQISRTDGSDDKKTWPSDNLILNCEAYNNCDPSKINADGFGAKLTVGEGNVFRNCKSHHNVDDGWDLYTKVSTGAIGAVTLENCVSYKNGIHLNDDGSETSYEAGGNNGFKLGGENVAVAHKLINCEAYDNEHNGVTTNSNPALILENVKCYNNKAANFRLYSDKPEEYAYTVTGAVSYGGGEHDVIGTVTENTEYKNNSTTPLLNSTNQFDID